MLFQTPPKNFALCLLANPLVKPPSLPCAFWISFPFAFTKPNRRAGRALNAHRRGVKLLLFDSKTFSSKKKKKF